MNEYPPRDYPANAGPALKTTEDANSLTLSSVKERLAAEQPVSNEMITTAVNNLFSADSHDAYLPSTPEQLETSSSSFRSWLKKPGKKINGTAK